jgi:hypothetical protein
MQRGQPLTPIGAPWQLWVLRKNGHTAVASARTIGGIGIELRLEWDGDLRASQMFKIPASLNEVAEGKRCELIARGWLVVDESDNAPE